MKKTLFSTLLMLSTLAHADSSALLHSSIEIYKNQGQKAFIGALLKNSPAADEKTKISSLESIFQQQENLCGKVISLDVVKELTVSPKVKNTYFVLNYEQCPLFGYAVTYDGAIGTILSWINVGSDPRQTFPSFIYTDK